MDAAQFVAEQRAGILADERLTAAERRDLLAWCDAGCPGDPFDDSNGDYETGPES